MTLIASAPTTSINQSDAPYLSKDATSDEDSQSDSAEDDVPSRLPCPKYPPQFDFEDAIVQCLGHAERGQPYIGGISVDSSSDVHIGDKNIYQGPVTIRQIVYSNGSASLVPNSDKAKDNLAFEGDDSDSNLSDLKDSQPKDCIKNPEVVEGAREAETSGSGLRKGFIWLQNVSKHRPMEIGIFLAIVVLFIVVLMIVLFLRHPTGKRSNVNNSNTEPESIRPIRYDPDITATSQMKNKLRMISRLEWVAQPPTNDTTPLVTPVPYVIIHHTATENCSSQSQCVFHVRQIQTFHIESRGWYDIGYNFLVGGDGAAYEGRGWIVEGAHTLGWNYRSIGIAFVGTFLNIPPPQIQIIACQKLIRLGIDQGYITKDYKLLGARQLFGTESPGAALLEEIKKWPHWTKEP